MNALEGGLLIGVAVSIMLFGAGRVAGISGILYDLFSRKNGDRSFCVIFLLGLLAGGSLWGLLGLRSELISLSTPIWTVPVAGFLVGFGTVLGSGCTSGHGVCGMSRLSPRSLVATLIFIFAGVMTVGLLRHLGVLT